MSALGLLNMLSPGFDQVERAFTLKAAKKLTQGDWIQISSKKTKIKKLLKICFIYESPVPYRIKCAA